MAATAPPKSGSVSTLPVHCPPRLRVRTSTTSAGVHQAQPRFVRSHSSPVSPPHFSMASPTAPMPNIPTSTPRSRKCQTRPELRSNHINIQAPPSPPQTPIHALTAIPRSEDGPATPLSAPKVDMRLDYLPSSPSLHVKSNAASKSNGKQGDSGRGTAQSLQSRWNNAKKHIELEGTIEIQKDSTGRKQEFGEGVWSKVYAAYLHISRRPSTSLSTPPLTASRATSRVVAVKRPSRRDGEEVLELEARILTYLHRTGRASSVLTDHIVPFIGYQPSSKSIVMEAIPLTLAAFTKDALASASRSLSTSTMFDPVIGRAEWSQLAASLISGLAHLHEHGIVHGDIKPRNILLRARNTGNPNPFQSSAPSNSSVYDAVYCDFSSSHFDQTTEPAPEVSAVTTSFTSPELLKAFYNTVGGSIVPVATRASDVYALGVTLITAAIGGDMYGGPRLMEMQRLAFARDGRPLDFARNGDQASRIMKGSFVSNVVEGAVKKEASARWTAAQWLQAQRSMA